MVSLSNHVAISLRLNTRRQSTIAAATRLPRCARNDNEENRKALSWDVVCVDKYCHSRTSTVIPAQAVIQWPKS